tara:strand:+ start:172 stop:687 length:516 start_codon:yes stop_codon:yes gene_type:complete
MIALLLLLSFISLCSSIDTVSDLKVEPYLGTWYQVYSGPYNKIIQGKGRCTTAEYGLLEENKISVLNSQIDSNNQLNTIGGYAYAKNESDLAKLTVKLDGVPSEAPYWVVAIGPIEKKVYQYSVVSEPNTIFMWVLARNVEDFFENYDEDVQEYLKSNNFKSVKTDQTNCD